MKKNYLIPAVLLAVTITGCGLSSQPAGENPSQDTVAEAPGAGEAASAESENAASTDTDAQTQDAEADNTQADSEYQASTLPVYKTITRYFSENYKGKLTEDKEGKSLQNMPLYKGSFQAIMLAESSKDSYPALYQALKGKAAEGVKLATESAERNTEAATEDLEYSVESDYSFYGYYYERTGASISRADDKVVSICNYGESFLGGAHGNYGLSSETYDVNTGTLLKLSDVISLTETELNPILKEKIQATAEDPDQFWDLDETLEDYKFDPTNTDPEDYENYEYSYTWYLDQEGIHFYFGPYEIAAYAYGATDVVITYDELKGQFNENYLPDSSKGYICKANLPMYPTEYDDDTSELHLVYEPYDGDATLNENDYLPCKSLTLKEKDRSAKAEIDYDFNYTISSVTPYKVVTDDGRVYIYVTVLSYNDYTELEIFQVTDTEIKLVGEKTMHMVYIDNDTDYVGELTLTDPHCFYLGSTGDMLGTYTYYARYEVGPDGMPKQLDDAFTISWGSKDIKSLKDISVTPIDSDGKEGAAETLPSGSILTPVKTDNATYVDCQTNDGKLIRLKYTKTSYPFEIEGTSVDDLFEGLQYAG